MNIDVCKPVDPELDRYIKYFRSQELCIIPLVYKHKKAAITEWTPYQTQQPTDEEIKHWFYNGATYNVGVVCGEVSKNLVVLDFENKKQAYKIFGKNIAKETFVVETGGGGLHIYYRLKEPTRTFRAHGGKVEFDVQCSGVYVVAPPSIHPDTDKPYVPVNFQAQPIADWPYDEFEETFFELVTKHFPKFDPQPHREPMDIVDILENGAATGSRNQSVLYLATWFRRLNKTEDEAFSEIEKWNNKLEHPLVDREIRRTIQSAYRKNEPYKFYYKQDPSAYKEIEQFDKEDMEQAEEFLVKPIEEKFKFIEYSLDEVVGEEKTKVALFVLEAAGESVHIAGDSAAGKSFLGDNVLGSPTVKGCFPNEYVCKLTGMTDKALRYLKGHVGTLYITEFAAIGKGNAEGESTAQFDIKLLISEGELRIITVEKNKETGKWEAVTYVNKNIKNVITTSTDVDVTDELKNRMWVLAIDESQAQTQRITQFALEESTKLPSERIHREVEKRVLRCATKKLLKEAPSKTVIPYALQMKPMLNSNNIRTRRDVRKLINAASTIAKLNYKIRPIVQECVVSTPEDFYFAMQYMDEAIQGTLTDETKRFWRVWNQLKTALDKNKLVDGTTVQQILRCSKQTGYNWLNKLQQAGMLRKVEVPRKGTRAQIIYVDNSVKVHDSEHVIEMSQLFDITEDWLRVHNVDWYGDSQDSKGKNQKNKFYNKKIILPYSTLTTLTNIIKSLPDAPDVINDIEEASMNMDGTIEGKFY